MILYFCDRKQFVCVKDSEYLWKECYSMRFVCRLFCFTHKGCVRLTQFRNRNTYNDSKKSLIRVFWSYWSTKSLLNYHVSVKACRNVFKFTYKQTSNSYFTYSSVLRNTRRGQSTAAFCSYYFLLCCPRTAVSEHVSLPTEEINLHALAGYKGMTSLVEPAGA